MRLIALDIGEKTIGLAISDPGGVIARPVETLIRRSYAEDLKTLLLRIGELQAEGVIVGYPVHVAGQKGTAVQRVEHLVRKLKPRCGLPIVGVDERYTTLEALELQPVRPRSGRRRQARIDENAIAAALILKRYLDEGEHVVLQRW